MTRRRYTEQQILEILKAIEGGLPVVEAVRQFQVGESTIYRWRAKYDGVDRSELRRLKALEEENARLKRLVAKQALENEALREVLGKDW